MLPFPPPHSILPKSASTSPLHVSSSAHNIISARLPSFLSCFLILSVLLFIYVSNDSFLVNYDSTATIMLPGQVIGRQKTSFDPREHPWMFSWKIKEEGKDEWKQLMIRNWNETLMESKGKNLTAWQALTNGMLFVNYGRFFLVPSKNRGSEYVNAFGIGTSISALPFFLIADIVLGVDIMNPNYELLMLSKFCASFFVAGSVVFVWMTACLYLPWFAALILALSYGLGTIVWPISSQTLFQHSANELFLAAGFFFLCRHSLVTRYESMIAESTIFEREKVKMEEEYEEKQREIKKMQDDEAKIQTMIPPASGSIASSSIPTFSISRQPERARKEMEAAEKAERELLAKRVREAFIPSSISRTSNFSSSLILSRFIVLEWNYDLVLASACFCWAVYCHPISIVVCAVIGFYLLLVLLCTYLRAKHANARSSIAIAASKIMNQRDGLITRLSKQSDNRQAYNDQDSDQDDTITKPAINSQAIGTINNGSFGVFPEMTKQLLIASCPSFTSLHSELVFRALRFVAEFSSVVLFFGFGFCSYNLLIFGDYFTTGQTVTAPLIAYQRTGLNDPWSTPILEGLAMLFISPSRGLLIFSPHMMLVFFGIFLIFFFSRPLFCSYVQTAPATAFDDLLFCAMEWVLPLDADELAANKTTFSPDAGMIAVKKSKNQKSLNLESKIQKQANLLETPSFVNHLKSAWIGVEKDWLALYPALLSCMLLVLLSSMWFDSYGGWTYGPLPIVDTLPIMSLLLIPVAQYVLEFGGFLLHDTRHLPPQLKSSNKLVSYLIVIFFIVTLAISVWVQFIGAFAYNQESWNRITCFALSCKESGTTEHSTFFLDLEEAKHAYQTDCKLIQTVCDINEMVHRHRLWDWNNNIISFYWNNFGAARKKKEEMCRNWSDTIAD